MRYLFDFYRPFWDIRLAIIPALIGGGAALIGGFMSNRASAKEAARNRDFQADMSATSHQRATADLEAAGLNRILSVTQGGATTPGGSMAAQHDPITPAVHTALATKMQSEQISNLREQRRILGAEADIKEIDAKKAWVQFNWQTGMEKTDGEWKSQMRWFHQWQEESKGAVAEAKTKQQTQETNVAIRKLEELLKKAEIPGAEAQAEFWKNVGEYLPYLKLLAGGASGAVGVAAAAKKLLSKAPGVGRFVSTKPWGGAGSSARSHSAPIVRPYTGVKTPVGRPLSP